MGVYINYFGHVQEIKSLALDLKKIELNLNFNQIH